MMEQNNLKIITNPIVNQSLCTMRNKNTDTEGVRLAARKLTRILLYEATKNLPQKDIEIEKIKQKFEELSKDYDYLLIEGAGGITCPLRLENGEKYLLKDLIKELETSIIIVADGGLGTINSTLLTVEYARANNIPIAGIILNNFNPDSFMHQDNLKQVEYLTGIKVVATVERGQKDIKLLEELWTGRKKI